ncbi:tyrosine-type recombinase/integrase [Pseudooctadecabacter jejudonensis]|uniref:Putative prophage CPS-53 integrase n=1 Tax=Pseudooctadecabacter jejudonensis TaxID=1391910 RepID=A0A1Y5R8S9_9RHOB|nr:integrase arm-type DNA-binding domain-containing protein [Pseudooctadecabacter jejudonensis]SLN10703.1 Putative prophage CPS-53 integrase [Pseudooctadecabacter jejudonensis]
MPKQAQKLRATQIDRLRPKHENRPTVYPVGHVSGLHIQITPNNARSWFLKTMIGTKRRHIGLGSCSEVLLGMAVNAAREAKEQIRNGVDPIALRQKARAALIAAEVKGPTFSDVMDAYRPRRAAKITAKNLKNWEAALNTYAVPTLGHLQVADIVMRDVLSVLEPIWLEKNEAATKLQRSIHDILDYAMVMEMRTGDNPARYRGNLQIVLPEFKGSKNYPTLQLKDVPSWWADLCEQDSMGAKALQFQAMTATRTGAVRHATWSEFDLEAGIWTVQPARVASKIPAKDRPKKVPLTPDMIELLKDLPRYADSDVVFHGPKGKALSDATAGKTMRMQHEAKVEIDGVGYVDGHTGAAAIPHGLRTAFRVWVSDVSDYEADLGEIALWHKLGSKTQQAYDRGDMVEKRRAMMEDWVRFLHASTS